MDAIKQVCFSNPSLTYPSVPIRENVLAYGWPATGLTSASHTD